MKHIDFFFDFLLYPLFFLNRLAFGEKGEDVYKKGYHYRLSPLILIPVGLFAFSTFSFGASSNNSTISITASKSVSEGDSASTDEDTAVNIDVLANDSGDGISISDAGSPSHGSTSISSGKIVYTPEANWHGTDSFDYTITDAYGGTATATVTVTVNAVNDTPEANDDSASTDVNSSVTIDVLSNDTDPDGDSLSIQSVTNPANGTATISSDKVVYTPNTDFSGTDTFDYTVSDGHGGTDTATVTVTVAANQAPVANDVAVTTTSDTNVTVHLDASDPDGDTISSYPIQTGPSHGTLSGAEPDITYTPDSGYSGTDTFTYKACDSKGLCSNEATVTVTVNAGPIHVANPSVCMESLTTSKAGGLVSACFNASGIFTGGPGCRQILKLRNLSDTPITHSDINVNYSSFSGALDGSCGIDGVGKAGSDCNVSSSPKEVPYNPLGSFDSYGSHSVYLGVTAAPGSTSPFDGSITINYEQNSTSYTGTLQKCQVATEPAEDLCYDSIDPIKIGMGMCMDFGFMSFGMATGGCGKQINLRNRGDDTLISPIVSVITKSFFSGSMMDECGIDGTAGNCTQNDVFNGPFMGMSGMGMPRSITYDPMPDFDSNDTHSTYSLSKFNMSVFPDTALMGQYIKDGKLYRGEIKMCSSILPGFQANGSMDTVDEYDSSDFEQGKGLKTKVAKKSTTVDVVYLGEDMQTPSTNGAADIPVFLYLLDDDCSNPVRLRDDSGNWLVATIATDQTSGTSENFTLLKIARAKRFGMKYIDYDKLIREGGPTCLQHSSTGGNAVPGLPSCVSSDHQYKLAFGDEAYQRCKVDNGQPCKPSNHGYGDAPYDHRYGCYECTLGITPGVCSSDNFAIRPDHFAIAMPDSDFPHLLRAGKDYNISLTAYDFGGATISADYNVSNFGASLEANTTKYFKDGTEDTSGLLHGTADVNTSVNIWSVGGMSSSSSTEPASAEAVVPVAYDDVGKVTLKVYDYKWAEIDNDDTPMDCDDSHDHTYICGEQNVTYIPDHFEVTGIHLRNHADGGFTYLSSDLNMSAHVDVNITAMNANNNATQNFRQGALYYENPVSVELNVTEWNAAVFGVSTRHPEGNSVLKHDIPIETLLGFGGVDANGTHNIPWNEANTSQQIIFNYTRQYNQTVNPFDVNGTDINISVQSTYTDSTGLTPSSPAIIVGSGIGDRNATFIFGRAKPNKYFYDNITTTSVATPVSMTAYCDLNLTGCQNIGLDAIANGMLADARTNEADWWVVEKHDVSTGDGNVTLTATNGTVSPTDPTPINPTNGIDETVTVTNSTGVTPNIVDIDFGPGTNTWLIYNKDADSIPSPFYRVRFIGTGGSWTGEGKTGHVVGDDINTKKTKRLEW